MVDFTIKDLEKLPEIIKNSLNIRELTPYLDSVERSLSEVGTKLERLKQQGVTSGAEFENLTDTYQKLSSASVMLNQRITDLGGSLSDLHKEFARVQEAPEGFEKLKKEVIGAGEAIASKLAPAIKESAALLLMNSVSWARDIVSPARDFNRFSTGAFKGLNDSLQDILDVQNLARINFMSLGQSIGESNEEAVNFVERMRASASALGLGLEETKKYNEQVRFIPDALRVANSALLEFDYLQDKNITVSQLAQVAMKAWGLSTEEAARVQSNAYTQLGRTGEDMINMLGEVHGAIKEGFMPAKMASEQIMEASNSLGIFGNKASIATNVWRTFASSLTTGGVAAAEVGKIVSQVTQNIASMSIQNRAFIGMMSNMFQGASALGGGLKMELMMRQTGGLERNLEALTSSLARFGGGQIFTLEQAANNPQLETQFVLQRQMLGKLAGITNQEQQNRVLEVLQGVQQGGISRVQGGKQLNDLMQRGTSIQENTVTAIQKLERTMGERLRQSNRYLSTLTGRLDVFQKLGMGREREDVYKSPVLQMGAGQSIAAAGKVETARSTVGEGLKGIGDDFSRFLNSKIKERQMERFQVQNPQVSVSIGEMATGIKKGFTEADIQALKAGSRPREIPTDALVPIIRGEQDNRAVSPPEKPSLSMRREDSTLTININADVKLKEKAMEILQDQLPKYVNGEFIPGE